uniref:hypothetical protein n=1 Tax=Methylogaea oryzae TaxID=1295382 RepID=UPI000AE3A54F
PARALNNLRELAQDPDVVAVMCTRYSPVVVETLPEIHRLKLPLLDPWAAADGITDNGYIPNYVFRLSLRDAWALAAMMRYAKQKGAHKVASSRPTPNGAQQPQSRETRRHPGNPPGNRQRPVV